jgi:hypothetical protein
VLTALHSIDGTEKENVLDAAVECGCSSTV